jgi:Sec7 domain
MCMCVVWLAYVSIVCVSYNDNSLSLCFSLLGINLFSVSYKRGLKFWIEKGLLLDNAEDIARFLQAHDVSKQELGELLGDR